MKTHDRSLSKSSETSERPEEITRQIDDSPGRTRIRALDGVDDQKDLFDESS